METSETKDCVRVAVNIRPLVTAELAVGCTDCISVPPSEPQVVIVLLFMYICVLSVCVEWKVNYFVYLFLWKINWLTVCCDVCLIGSNRSSLVHIRLCFWKLGATFLTNLWGMCCSPCWCTLSGIQWHCTCVWPGSGVFLLSDFWFFG